MSTPDDYRTLGISPGVSDAELRAAYRRAVRLHHPDHNEGSAESTRRFEEIQEAYTRIQALRARPAPPTEPGLDARLTEMERELAAARQARARANAAAREAARTATSIAQDDARERPSDEQLGYISTEDSFTKILADAAAKLADAAARFADEHRQR